MSANIGHAPHEKYSIRVYHIRCSKGGWATWRRYRHTAATISCDGRPAEEIDDLGRELPEVGEVEAELWRISAGKCG